MVAENLPALVALAAAVVEVSGIVAAVPESVTVRVPAAFGLTCQRSADTVYAVLGPADPGRDTTQNGFGIAKLESGGYDFGLDPVDTIMVADTTMCAAVGVRLPPDGQLTQLRQRVLRAAHSGETIRRRLLPACGLQGHRERTGGRHPAGGLAAGG